MGSLEGKPRVAPALAAWRDGRNVKAPAGFCNGPRSLRLRLRRRPRSVAAMRRIAVFARWPAAGRVKTRLSPAVPVALACEIHRAMLADTLEAASRVDAGERFLYWADAPEARDGFAPPDRFRVRDQQGHDLGERLGRAFAELLVTPADRAVIVGADCPALDAESLGAAFEALDSRDAVLGPARDGGYWLVGLGRNVKALFHGIEWSTPRVLDQTLERAAREGVELERLETLDDLDTPEDLLRWIARRMAGAGPRAPRALDRLLREIGLLPPG